MEQIKTVYTSSVEETERCAQALALQVTQEQSLPRFIALYGDLGVGKTAFVRGFASIVAPKSAVRSPTFALVNEYRANPISLFHFDMYRIEDEDDLFSIGFDDYLTRKGIILTEWSEKIPWAIPESVIKVLIEKNDPASPDCRKITIQTCTEESI